MTHSGSFSISRSPEEVFALLSKPEWFAAAMPDFESITIQDATHFTMRTAFALGEIKGHTNLAMELCRLSPPNRVEYCGLATIAGGPLRLAIDFQLEAQNGTTEVSWQGDVKLGGMLAKMAGTLLDTVGRRNFGRMAENLQARLHRDSVDADGNTGAIAAPPEPDVEI
jgi:uncharacterized protein